MQKNLIQKILIYNSGGGIGDSVQLFPLILSLNNHNKRNEIYYLGAHENHYIDKLKEFNIKIKKIDLGLKYFGFRWWHLLFVRRKFIKTGIKKFDLIIDLQSKIRNTIILKKIPSNNFYSSTYNFYFCSLKRKFIFNSNLVEMTLTNLKNFFGSRIKRMDYNLENLPKNIIKEAKRLLPNQRYIGFSITQGNEYRKKSWPIENFIELANKIRIKNKVPVFFVENKYTDLIEKIKSEVPNALFPEHKSKISCPALVTALSMRLDKAVSIDNGIMHMIGLANIPMIVLFGPTNTNKFAPRIKDIKILDTKDLYKSYDISKISVNDVLKYI